MPHITGYDLAKRILEIKPAVPVILCTGYSDTVTLEKAEACGIRALIYKPISKKEIASKIREVLDEKENTPCLQLKFENTLAVVTDLYKEAQNSSIKKYAVKAQMKDNTAAQ